MVEDIICEVLCETLTARCLGMWTKYLSEQGRVEKGNQGDRQDS